MDHSQNWGNCPWRLDFRPHQHSFPDAVDFAIVGGGFCGLAAAIQLKSVARTRSVAVLEAQTIGSGASGHTGGVALAESAAGDLPGLGDVLGGYRQFTRAHSLETGLDLPGCYELSRSNPLPDSPIHWSDSGELCATKLVPGGTIDPGKTVSELARVAEEIGVEIFEYAPLNGAKFDSEIDLHSGKGNLRAAHALFATNAFALEISGIQGHPAFTTAVLTEPLSDDVLRQIGMAERKPFYTVDLPYLWGRLLGNSVMFGCGLLFFDDWRELYSLDINSGKAPGLFELLENRVHALHPALAAVKFTNRWGGPICISDDWKPVFRRHPQSSGCLALGAFSGHGVALSVYLGVWAADVLLGNRSLPEWS